MNKKKFLQIANWIIPPNIFRLLTFYRPSAIYFAITHRNILNKNKKFHNIHTGKRCFILCNGPSVKSQNILPLKNEIVFSVSSGYMHPDYELISPRYHCVPQLTYTDKFTIDTAIKWFGEINDNIGDAELFLDCEQFDLVNNKKLFVNKNVSFLCTGKNYFPADTSIIPNISQILPRPQSVPIIAIIIALNMGFKEIYLLGTDHDWFVKKEYKYFYEPQLLRGLDTGVSVDGIIETKLWDELPNVKNLWSQYRYLKEIAENIGTKIYNSTPNSMLDEFDMVRLEDVLISKNN